MRPSIFLSLPAPTWASIFDVTFVALIRMEPWASEKLLRWQNQEDATTSNMNLSASGLFKRSPVLAVRSPPLSLTVHTALSSHLLTTLCLLSRSCRRASQPHACRCALHWRCLCVPKPPSPRQKFVNISYTFHNKVNRHLHGMRVKGVRFQGKEFLDACSCSLWHSQHKSPEPRRPRWWFQNPCCLCLFVWCDVLAFSFPICSCQMQVDYSEQGSTSLDPGLRSTPTCSKHSQWGEKSVCVIATWTHTSRSHFPHLPLLSNSAPQAAWLPTALGVLVPKAAIWAGLRQNYLLGIYGFMMPTQGWAMPGWADFSGLLCFLSVCSSWPCVSVWSLPQTNGIYSFVFVSQGPLGLRAD